MTRKIIAVIGATGAQGGGLARAILRDSSEEFAVRALTRTPDSAKARELADLGADVVAADLDDPTSLQKAFTGAHGAYCLTNYWEHLNPEKETAQAHALAQAAQDAGVAHVIWSTLEDTRLRIPLDEARMPTLQGRYKVPHLDAKGEADQHFEELGVPTTFLHTSFYWENFIFFGMGPAKGPDGRLAITLPMGEARLPGSAVEDIGKCAYGIFKRGEEMVGTSIGIAGEHLTGTQMAAAFSRALGQEVVYHAVEPGVYRSLGFPGAEDLGNMFQYKRDFNTEYCASRDLEFSRSLNPELQTFPRWLEQHRSRLSLG
jgi:uncharacterized protein YbjT (DUF2867 family)